MRQAELDIVTADGKRYNDTMEVDSNADLTDIATVARQLLGICRWQKVRVGVGSQLSNWITEPLKPNNNDFQKQEKKGLRGSHERNGKNDCRVLAAASRHLRPHPPSQDQAHH